MFSVTFVKQHSGIYFHNLRTHLEAIRTATQGWKMVPSALTPLLFSFDVPITESQIPESCLQCADLQLGRHSIYRVPPNPCISHCPGLLLLISERGPGSADQPSTLEYVLRHVRKEPSISRQTSAF